MRAFVTEIAKFLRMNTEIEDESINFKSDRRKLRIPLYQREYKWEDEKNSAVSIDVNHLP